jgi:predicted MFS family arabinose efflux permease
LSVIFGGFMIANVAGLPLATLVDQHLGWRASFWAVNILVALCLVLVITLVRPVPATEGINLRTELTVFRRGRLWTAYGTNALLIGAVFAAFAYLSPILTELGGFSAGVVPLLFVLYGVGTVIGNIISGRLADSHTMGVLWVGGAVLAALLAVYSLTATDQTASLVLLFLLGLVGLPLNPAMAARVMKNSNSGSLVNTMNTATICVGITVGTALAGWGIDADGYRAPLWIGALLAVAALLALLMSALTRRSARSTGTVDAVRSAPLSVPR